MGIFAGQLNKRRDIDDKIRKAATESLYKDLTYNKGDGRFAFAENEVKEYITSNLLHYFKIPMAKGILDLSLDKILEKNSIISKTVKIDEKLIENAITPFLCVYKDTGKEVLLLPSKFLGYVYVDFNGKRHKVTKAFIETLNSNAISYYKCFALKELSIKDFFSFLILLLDFKDICAYFACAIFITILGLFAPFFNNIVFGTVVVLKEKSLLLQIVLALLVISVTREIIAAIKDLLKKRVSHRQGAYINVATMYRALTLPVSFYRKNMSGEIVYRLLQINNICNMLIDVMMDSLVTTIFSIIYIYQISLFSKSLVLPALLIIIGSTIITIVCSILRAKYSMMVMETNSKESGFSYNIISGIQKIKLTGSESRAYAKWTDEFKKLLKIQYLPPYLVKHSEFLVRLVNCVGMVYIYLVCIVSAISSPDYIAFLTSFGMVSAAFINFSSITEVFANVKTSLDFVKPILVTSPENNEGKKSVERVEGDIVFSKVSFSYEKNGIRSLDDIDLEIRKGEYVAVVGKSGCGKSTLIRLLLGFEKPDSGSIYIDNTDIRDINLSSLRKNIGSVFQNEGLYTMDIKSNILISKPDATTEELDKAIRLSAIEEVYDLPMGINTLVSDNKGLSSGQKQRILLARCFITNAGTMIFDEATNALDIATEKKVFTNIKNLNCTRIVIAHTFSAMKDADKIVVLNEGKVAEIGTYDELIKKNGMFCDLINADKISKKG